MYGEHISTGMAWSLTTYILFSDSMELYQMQILLLFNQSSFYWLSSQFPILLLETHFKE